MEEQKESTGATGSSTGANTVITEKRVTKRVIRRRAKPKSAVEEEQAQLEAKAAAEAAAQESAKMAEAEKAAAMEKIVEPKPSPEKKAKPEKSSFLKKVQQKLEPKTPKVQKRTAPQEAKTKKEEKEEEDAKGYQSKYKRIKVVATPSEPEASASPIEAPRKLSPEQLGKIQSQTKPSSPLASPSSLGLGRKEIIEIRDFHRPKGGRKRKMGTARKGKKTEITTPKAAKRVIRLSDAVTVGDLGKKMGIKANELIGKLMSMGMIVTINQTIDLDTATLVASEFGYEIENVQLAPEDILLEQDERLATNPEDLVFRPPVVTVMGHVDHGKTSLLDAIRKTDVASREAGGITQHIGAYSVKTESGKQVTFIDTPGHAAFTAMRARGAQVTDVVVLVVAADDGVMPQTKEAVNHAQSAKVPIIVAVNKMDKPGADPDKIKKQLTEFNLVPEEWGGDTIFVPVSAKKGDGISQLLDYILLQAEVLELKANPKKVAKGIIVEAGLDKRRGSVITVLVREGTIKQGDIIVTGAQFGRIRAMNNDRGQRVKEAGPSTAVEIMGLSQAAHAGDEVIVCLDERKAKQVAELRQKITKQQEMAKTSKVTLDDLYQKIEQGDVKELKLVVKADTAGSVEVLTDSLHKLSTPKVAVRVIHGGVGGISENDVNLAKASGALIVGFHVRPTGSVTNIAERQQVEIRLYTVIYELTEDITKAMAGLLAPKEVENVLGHAEVRDVFSIPKIGNIAGCAVTDGKIRRSARVRLIRDSVPVYEGTLKSLKRFKDDVREVATGLECGIGIENFNDIKVGDVIEAFTIEEVAASLE